MVVLTGVPLGSATTYVIVTSEYFNTTNALALLFYPKVVIICILVVCLSRVRLRGQLSKHEDQSKSMTAKTREHTRFSVKQGISGGLTQDNGNGGDVETGSGLNSSGRGLGVGIVTVAGTGGQRGGPEEGRKPFDRDGTLGQDTITTTAGTEGDGEVGRAMEGYRSTTRLVPSTSVESIPGKGGKK